MAKHLRKVTRSSRTSRYISSLGGSLTVDSCIVYDESDASLDALQLLRCHKFYKVFPDLRATVAAFWATWYLYCSATRDDGDDRDSNGRTEDFEVVGDTAVEIA
ncbi:hypothetical protein L916_08441 [Phytophthora nicotianae]|uniref:Uncharacterized protein n=1 Tax=Phytophthora nicotianae TaxID=4792 RepID=W2J1T7_PHYNI|nr:hypothetical protein L916_08441 [Phytophthora nicotianae]